LSSCFAVMPTGPLLLAKAIEPLLSRQAAACLFARPLGPGGSIG